MCLAAEPSPRAQSATTGQSYRGADREPIPDPSTRGQLALTPQQREQIRQSVKQTNVEEQPVPRAFAPAAGMTAPPELQLTPLPQELQQIAGGPYQFARLKQDIILIVNSERLIVAMLLPDQAR